MASLFTKSGEAPSPRFKIFAWGDSGSGKTTAGLSCPAPAVVDFLERGSEQYRSDFEFSYLNAKTIEDANNAVSELARGGHDRKTFVFDPFTLYAEAVTDKWLEHFRSVKSDPNYEMMGLDYRGPKREMRSLIRRLIALDCNVFVSSREKAKYIMQYNPQKRKNEMVQDGVTFEGYNQMKYEFDLVLHLEAVEGGSRWTVEKFRGSRFAKLPTQHTFAFGQFYHDFSNFVGEVDGMEAETKDTSSAVDLHLGLVESLRHVGLGDMELPYMAYVLSKYGLSSPTDLSEAESEEQKKILGSLAGNEARLEAFKQKLMEAKGE